MKASFNITVSVTPPGSYTNCHLSVGGDLIWDGDGDLGSDDVATVLDLLDEKYRDARSAVEASLLEVVRARRVAVGL